MIYIAHLQESFGVGEESQGSYTLWHRSNLGSHAHSQLITAPAGTNTSLPLNFGLSPSGACRDDLRGCTEFSFRSAPSSSWRPQAGRRAKRELPPVARGSPGALS